MRPLGAHYTCMQMCQPLPHLFALVFSPPVRRCITRRVVYTHTPTSRTRPSTRVHNPSDREYAVGVCCVGFHTLLSVPLHLSCLFPAARLASRQASSAPAMRLLLSALLFVFFFVFASVFIGRPRLPGAGCRCPPLPPPLRRRRCCCYCCCRCLLPPPCRRCGRHAPLLIQSPHSLARTT
jgi:hypothetical protein